MNKEIRIIFSKEADTAELAALYRELFILQNNLDYTRNFPSATEEQIQELSEELRQERLGWLSKFHNLDQDIIDSIALV